MMEVRIQMKSVTKGMRHRCKPIIEEPATPEPECLDTLERAIEDAFWTEDPDEIPMIKLNIKEFMQNVDMQEKGELQDVDMSRALVALTQEAATIPMPKLKNVSRLQTEHQVYELPDARPLLAKLDRRMLDDPCTYLLTVWTPGETAQSIQPPEIDCTSQKSGNLCSKKTCFTCNSMREANAQAVKGTLLIYIWEILNNASLKKRPIFCFSHASTPLAGGGSRGRGPKKRHNPNRSRKKTEGLPVGSKNKPKPPNYMTRESNYTTQTTMIEIPPDADIVNGVTDFAFRRRIGICILSCNGAVANVSFIDSTSSHAHASTVTLNGRFETLSLYATFLTYPIPPPPSQSSSSGCPTKLPITISLARANEQVIGGKVVEALIVAGPVVVVAASFRYISLLRLQPVSEKANDTNPSVGVANACCGDAGLWRPSCGDASLRHPSSEHHQSPVSFIENALVVQYYFTINRQLPSSKMPWLCSTISMMLGVAINSDQRKRLIALPAVVMPIYGAPVPNTINRQLPSSKMPWLCSTISMMLGVAINSDQRKRLTASPAVVMPIYGAPAPNTINRQFPSSKMPWLCSTISMMLGVAINSDQRKRLTPSPRWERFQDTKPKAISEESALPAVAMPVYGAPAPNTINR